mmetsp:Transcript_41497/g.50291  ORF Transcript_41497/g.50291 Transcript_41497/m.50291 type:complete len:723 (+) Transcript_41497:321-2489(+)
MNVSAVGLAVACGSLTRLATSCLRNRRATKPRITNYLKESLNKEEVKTLTEYVLAREEGAPKVVEVGRYIVKETNNKEIEVYTACDRYCEHEEPVVRRAPLWYGYMECDSKKYIVLETCVAVRWEHMFPTETFFHALFAMLHALRFLWGLGFLHGDVEPNHFMLNQAGVVVSIDFDKSDGTEIPTGDAGLRMAHGNKWCAGQPCDVYPMAWSGKHNFASVNQVSGMKLTCACEIQQVVYTTISLFTRLPWEQLQSGAKTICKSLFCLGDKLSNLGATVQKEFVRSALLFVSNDHGGDREFFRFLNNLYDISVACFDLSPADIEEEIRVFESLETLGNLPPEVQECRGAVTLMLSLAKKIETRVDPMLVELPFGEDEYEGSAVGVDGRVAISFKEVVRRTTRDDAVSHDDTAHQTAKMYPASVTGRQVNMMGHQFEEHVIDKLRHARDSNDQPVFTGVDVAMQEIPRGSRYDLICGNTVDNTAVRDKEVDVHCSIAGSVEGNAEHFPGFLEAVGKVGNTRPVRWEGDTCLIIECILTDKAENVYQKISQGRLAMYLYACEHLPESAIPRAVLERTGFRVPPLCMALLPAELIICVGGLGCSPKVFQYLNQRIACPEALRFGELNVALWFGKVHVWQLLDGYTSALQLNKEQSLATSVGFNSAQAEISGLQVQVAELQRQLSQQRGVVTRMLKILVNISSVALSAAVLDAITSRRVGKRTCTHI